MFRVQRVSNDKRKVLIGIKATRRERQQLRNLAKRAGVSMSDFTRRGWQLAAQQINEEATRE